MKHDGSDGNQNNSTKNIYFLKIIIRIFSLYIQINLKKIDQFFFVLNLFLSNNKA